MYAQVNVYTRSYDNGRSGANLQESVLTPANVNAANFGKLFTIHLDGQVYAQPLYVSALQIAGGTHNVVFVASMRNTVYALDADTGSALWTQNFGPPINPQEVESDQNISWNTGLGILGTPVIDPNTKTMYFVSANESKVNGVNLYEFRLNAINILNGLPVFGSPMSITATYSTADLINPLIFTAFKQNQRPGLALSNGNVYIAFASHQDGQPYHGWVLAYSASTLQQTAVYSDTTMGVQGGIWNAGQAPTVDTYGNLYISTGNGSFGRTPNGLVQTGNSFIKLSASLQLLDYFTPTNSAILNSGDQDLGSSGLLLIPNTRYILGGGKQGVLYLVDSAAMGEFNTSADQVKQEFQGVYGKGTSHIHGAPVYFDSALNGPVTYLWGENDVLRAYSFNATTNLLNTAPLATSTMTAPVTNNYGSMPGGFVSISANGNANGIVWASTPYDGDAVHAPVHGALYAFNADTLELLWSDKLQDARDDIGQFAKYCPPVVANGKMYIPNWGAAGNADGTGSLVVYGILPQVQQLPVLTVAVANASSTVGLSLPAYIGTVSGLTNGDMVGGTIIVSYSSAATSNSAAGTYPITATITGSSAPNYRVLVKPGTLTILASPPVSGTGAISFGAGFSGSNLQLNGSAHIVGNRLELTNGGTYQTASAFYPTAVNTQRFTNDFTFQLTNPGADGFAMIIQGVGPMALGSPGGSLGFGPGAAAGMAKSVAVKFDLYDNAGEGNNSTGLYTNGAMPTTPAIDLTHSGISLKSGDLFSVHCTYDGALLAVTLTDTVTGSQNTQSYPIDIPGTIGGATGYVGFSGGTGGITATQDVLSWVYAPTPNFTSGFTASQVTLNGGAFLSGTTLRLLDGGAMEARSAFLTTPVNVQRFSSSFNFQLTNASADGFAFVLQAAGPTALGGLGGSLGFGPLQAGGSDGIAKSVAIKFDLYNNTQEGPNSTGIYLNGVTPFMPSINLTGSGIDLHSGDIFSAALSYDGATLTVTITDTVTLVSTTQTYTVDIPGTLGSPTGYVGFTGGTGIFTTTADIQTWSFGAGGINKAHLVYPTPGLAATTSGPALRVFQWTSFPDGSGTVFDSIQTGNSVTFNVTIPASGIYDITVASKLFPTRGIFQLAVDGVNAGPASDQYAPATAGLLKLFDLGTATLGAGKHSFTFTVTGRNPNSRGSTLSFGQLILTGQ